MNWKNLFLFPLFKHKAEEINEESNLNYKEKIGIHTLEQATEEKLIIVLHIDQEI